MKAIVHQEEDRTRAVIVSFLFHAVFFALLWFYKIHGSTAPVITPEIVINFENLTGGGGDNASAGEPDKGMNSTPPPVGEQMEEPEPTKPVEDPKPEPKPAKPEPAKPSKPEPTKADVPKNTPTTEDPEVAAVRKAQKEKQERDRKERDEADRKKREESDRIAAVEREKQRAAQAESDRKAREKAEYEKKKGKYGSTFGKPGGTGQGEGDGGKPGQGGAQNGTGDNPFGKTPGTGGGSGGGAGSGSGEGIGGGLRGRKVTARPDPNCPVSEKGKVVVKVTVDANGRVTSAEAILSGSTLTDSQSKACAVQTARGFRFAPASAASQTGTIEVKFNFN